MKYVMLLCLTGMSLITAAQWSPEQVHSDFVLQQRRISFDRTLREKTINAAFAMPLDSNSEDQYREACWAIAQFLLTSPQIETGFRTLFINYDAVELSTKRALVEAVYAVYPRLFKKEITDRIARETDPKLFAMQAVYLYRLDSTSVQPLRSSMQHQFPAYPAVPVLAALDNYLLNYNAQHQYGRPDLASLFRFNAAAGRKIIYSFQRWNRDWPGLATIQLENGTFARDSSGRLLLFRQLARSGSDLPYFITNGSTPQGIYSIQGTAVSRNHLIGPTPNIQLVMPGEADSVFWHSGYDSSQTSLVNYLQLLPDDWRSYPPMMEAYTAGHAGRSEIIAHGTAIDPSYFTGKPYYPLTPTMGCLCAKETWNSQNGAIAESEQLQLVNSFVADGTATGYLFVINLDNAQRAVTVDEVEKLVAAFEKIKRMP